MCVGLKIVVDYLMNYWIECGGLLMCVFCMFSYVEVVMVGFGLIVFVIMDVIEVEVLGFRGGWINWDMVCDMLKCDYSM